MTQAEQWQEINYPTFFGAIGDKIMAARQAMSAIPAKPSSSDDWLETNVNGVPILWREDGDDVWLKIGLQDAGDHEPMYSITIPREWLAA